MGSEVSMAAEEHRKVRKLRSDNARLEEEIEALRRTHEGLREMLTERQMEPGIRRDLVKWMMRRLEKVQSLQVDCKSCCRSHLNIELPSSVQLARIGRPDSGATIPLAASRRSLRATNAQHCWPCKPHRRPT